MRLMLLLLHDEADVFKTNNEVDVAVVEIFLGFLIILLLRMFLLLKKLMLLTL